jgi:hypothetical protein
MNGNIASRANASARAVWIPHMQGATGIVHLLDHCKAQLLQTSLMSW